MSDKHGLFIRNRWLISYWRARADARERKSKKLSPRYRREEEVAADCLRSCAAALELETNMESA